MLLQAHMLMPVGQMASEELFHLGDVTARMIAAKGPGVVMQFTLAAVPLEVAGQDLLEAIGKTLHATEAEMMACLMLA